MDARYRKTSGNRSRAAGRTTSWILRQRSQVPENTPPAQPVVASTYDGELPASLLERLVKDPQFQVMTLDRRHWICPYTGRTVPAIMGRMPAARAYLEQSGVWRTMEPLPLHRLQIERWRHELLARLGTEPRLRLFSRQGRGWLNPYSGELATDVGLDDGQLSPKTITAMATVLAACPVAASGRMLDQEELLARYDRLRGSPPSAVTPAMRSTTDTTEVVWIGDPSPAGPVAPAVTAVSRPQTEDLSQARKVQERLLTDLPAIEGVHLGVHFAPHSVVSGDFYHAATLADGRLLVLVGDVSGHGVQAALVVASALKTLRFVLRDNVDLRAIALDLNDELRQDLLPGQFVSLFLAAIDPAQRRIEAICCGHHPALLINPRRENAVIRLGRPGMALGLADRGTFEPMLKPIELPLEAGDCLVQVTDGVLEASTADERPWGEGRWMASVLNRCEDGSAQEIADGVVMDCHAFTRRGVEDDCTVLVAALADNWSN